MSTEFVQCINTHNEATLYVSSDIWCASVDHNLYRQSIQWRGHCKVALRYSITNDESATPCQVSIPPPKNNCSIRSKWSVNSVSIIYVAILNVRRCPWRGSKPDKGMRWSWGGDKNSKINKLDVADRNARYMRRLMKRYFLRLWDYSSRLVQRTGSLLRWTSSAVWPLWDSTRGMCPASWTAHIRPG